MQERVERLPGVVGRVALRHREHVHHERVRARGHLQDAHRGPRAGLPLAVQAHDGGVALARRRVTRGVHHRLAHRRDARGVRHPVHATAGHGRERLAALHAQGLTRQRRGRVRIELHLDRSGRVVRDDARRHVPAACVASTRARSAAADAHRRRGPRARARVSHGTPRTPPRRSPPHPTSHPNASSPFLRSQRSAGWRQLSEVFFASATRAFSGDAADWQTNK